MNIAEMETEIGKIETSQDSLNVMINNIGDKRVQINGGLDVTMAVLPSIIDLTDISYAVDGLTIGGEGTSEVEVLSYAAKLRESGLFSQVIISAMEKTEDGMSFTLTLWTAEQG